MKKLYTLVTLGVTFILCGCSKDFLKKYDSRIVGTWHISNINRIGFGGNTNNLPFADGSFTFRDDGSLIYLNSANQSFNGSWDIEKKVINDQTIRGLQVTAVNFTNQQVISEYYDDMNFVSTNHFKADLIGTSRTYVTHFRR